MSSTASFRHAWGIALAPALLFLPAFWLARMGPCTFSHPTVMLIASLIFIGLEIAALTMFVRAFRLSVSVVAGIGFAVLLLVGSVFLGYIMATEFM
jgi:uncharacterized membrane protein